MQPVPGARDVSELRGGGGGVRGAVGGIEKTLEMEKHSLWVGKSPNLNHIISG